ncbi:hypothetical protein H6F95_31910 [Cyanobacteria bacterium FACHB-471]|nr:hypothetical protein [Cyanobacteria bacterium FACHB-471]
MCDDQWFAKTIVESDKAQEIVDRARTEYDSFEEVWDGLTWLLARKGAEIGEEYQGQRIYKTRGVDGAWTVPSILVLYKVKEHEVEILSILVTGPEPLTEFSL